MRDPEVNPDYAVGATATQAADEHDKDGPPSSDRQIPRDVPSEHPLGRIEAQFFSVEGIVSPVAFGTAPHSVPVDL